VKKQKTSRRPAKDRLEFRRLHPYSASDISAWNKLLHSSQKYFLQNFGTPARSDAAQRMFSEIPTGKTENDKYVFALCDDTQMFGFADLVRDYPRPEVASIRFFMIAESHRNTGLGTALFDKIVERVASWNCNEIQLGVCTTNTNGYKFWRRVGFKTVRTEPLPGYPGDAIIMQRMISAVATRSQRACSQQSCAQSGI
jgi:GNAT superfamily N-acetyltransferase